MNYLTRKLVTREGFMIMLIASVGGFASVAFGIPILGYLLQPLFQEEPKVWRTVGKDGDFKVGETVQVNFEYADQPNSSWAGTTRYTSAWLRKVQQSDGTIQYIAFAIYCTHLGCPVNWQATPQLFLCPCHGSVFNADGTVAGGPAPRRLFNYLTQVVNGEVQIRTEQQPTVGFTSA